VRVVLLAGLPGSGKSTWLAQRGLFALSTDEIRRWLTDDAASQTRNARVFATLRFLLRERLAAGCESTYIDATNLTRTERRVYRTIAKAFDASVEAVFFDVPVDECKRRNAGRDRVVPNAVIDAMADRLQIPVLDEGFTRIDVVTPEPAAKE
jgi:predicted kinase